MSELSTELPAFRGGDEHTPTPSLGFDLSQTSWHSYPSIYNLGHKAIDRLFHRQVIIEEKVDGSQFSFGWFPDKDKVDGLGLLIKSKAAFIHYAAPPAMFRSAVTTVLRLKEEGKLKPGWTYRGEVLAKPKHNALTYDRVPNDNIIIYDVNVGQEAYLGIEARKQAASDLGLESIPVLYVGEIDDPSQLRRFLDTVSVLGGQKIEGVVIKPFNRDYFGEDRKLLMGKFVSEAFKEVHRKTWGIDNPRKGDIIERIQKDLANAARWGKAIIHLRERGLIEDSPKDIGPLIMEIQADILKEETEALKDALFKAFKDDLLRGAIRGFPEWYKQQLMAQQFEKDLEASKQVE